MFLRSRCACSSAVLCRYKLRRTKLKFEFTIYTFFAKWLVFRLLLRYLRCSRKLFSNTQISRSVVSFDFIFISFHFTSLYPLSWRYTFFTIFIVHFLCHHYYHHHCHFLRLRKPKCLLIFIWFGICSAIRTPASNNEKCSIHLLFHLFAVRILKMHFSLSQHPHNLLLGE